MTVKQFFKSTAFRCIAALLAILLVCAVFLTVMYGFLEVTDGEKLQRSIAKMYSGMEVKVYGLDDDGNEIEIGSGVDAPKSLVGEAVTIENAEISEAYKVVYNSNGSEHLNYLVTSTGFGGYDNGTVTCSVAVAVENENICGLYRVSIQSNVGQSFISRVTDDALNEFAELYEDGVYYTQEMITGATVVRTKTAICNAVNGAIAYVSQNILGKKADNKFEGFEYTSLINTTLSDYGGSVVDGVITYSVVTLGYSPTSAFTIEIEIVSADGTPAVQSVRILTSGSVAGRGKTAEEYDALIYNDYNGKTLQYFKDMLGDDMEYPGDQAGKDISTGASRSSYNVAYACAFALANYEKVFAALGGNAQ